MLISFAKEKSATTLCCETPPNSILIFLLGLIRSRKEGSHWSALLLLLLIGGCHLPQADVIEPRASITRHTEFDSSCSMPHETSRLIRTALATTANHAQTSSASVHGRQQDKLPSVRTSPISLPAQVHKHEWHAGH
jgi:hypothetical protein